MAGHEWAIGPYLSVLHHRSSFGSGWATSTPSVRASARRTSRRRAPVPSHLHSGRASRRSLLGRPRHATIEPLASCAGRRDSRPSRPGWPRDAASPAAARIRVVTSTADLKALTAAVGGDLSRSTPSPAGNQNPHDLEIRPSQMVKLRRADLVVLNGLDLDGWAEVSIQGANNPRIIPGATGRVDASVGVPSWKCRPAGWTARWGMSIRPVTPTTPSIRAWPPSSPATSWGALTRVAPGQRPAFEAARAAFLSRLEPAMAVWTRTLEPYRGAKVVVDHSLWTTSWPATASFSAAPSRNDRYSPAPGSPGSARLSDEGDRGQGADPGALGRPQARRATGAETGARVVPLAPAPAPSRAPMTYLDWMTYNVTTLAQALR